MNKHSINPVTIQPEDPWQHMPKLTIGRMAFGFGGQFPEACESTVQVVLFPPDTTADNANEKVVMTVLPQSLLIEALGHLFPAGELSQTHMADELKVKSGHAVTSGFENKNPCVEIPLTPPQTSQLRRKDRIVAKQVSHAVVEVVLARENNSLDEDVVLSDTQQHVIQQRLDSIFPLGGPMISVRRRNDRDETYILVHADSVAEAQQRIAYAVFVADQVVNP